MKLTSEDLLKIANVVNMYDNPTDSGLKNGTKLKSFIDELENFGIYENQRVEISIRILGFGDNSGCETVFDCDDSGFFYISDKSK
jgi:hypothetical protein